MALPTGQEIEKWDDEKLEHVHHLLYDKNIDPSLGDSDDDVYDYYNNVHIIFEKRFKSLDKSKPQE